MIAPQRHRLILDRLHNTGGVQVSDLARLLEVAEETVRRDLRDLAEQGRLIRTHGGAVPAAPADGRVDLPYNDRHAAHRAAKAAIARAAAAHVEPGQVIALDASTTACRLAQELPDAPLTVVTNSLAVCLILAPRKKIDVVCTGGSMDPDAMALYGLHAERTLESINIDCLYFSCRGVDLDRGLSEASEHHAAIKRRLLSASRRRILLADTSKFALRSAVYFAPIDAADLLITEATGDAESFLAAARTRGVVVEAAEG